MNEFTTFSGVPAALLAIFLTNQFKPLIPDDRYVPLVALAIGWVLGTIFALASGAVTGAGVPSIWVALLQGLLAGASTVGFHSTATSLKQPRGGI